MIDWDATAIKFGITKDSKLGKRPKIVCKCDVCQKSSIITVRVKARLAEGFPWKCPSCVCLGRSSKISEVMVENWNDYYANNAKSIDYILYLATNLTIPSLNQKICLLMDIAVCGMPGT